MAVDPAQAETDLFGGQRFHEHDERVRHGDNVYYVRQVRDASALTSGSVSWLAAEPLVLLLLPFVLVAWLWRRLRGVRAARHEEWIVGVVVLPAPDTFQSWSGPRVVHTEHVEGDGAAEQRIDELVAQIRSGRRRYRPD